MIRLRKPRITEEKKKQIVMAYNQGLTLEAIAEKYDVAIATIYRVIKEK